jgi:hypothetical protein
MIGGRWPSQVALEGSIEGAKIMTRRKPLVSKIRVLTVSWWWLWMRPVRGLSVSKQHPSMSAPAAVSDSCSRVMPYGSDY